MTNQQSNRSNDALIPAIILFGSLTLLLFAILPPAASKPAASSTSTSAATTVAAVPTGLPPTAAVAVAVAAYDPAVITQGQGVFQSICSTCHGMDGQGIPGLGKNLITSEFVAGLTDAELLQFIIKGRDSSDPLNTTGIPMPPRGGNPSLTDEELTAVIAYLRSQEDPSLMGHVMESGAPAAAPTAVPTSESAALAPTTQVETILPTTIPTTPQPFTAAAAYTWSCSGCHGAAGVGNAPFGPSLLDSPLLKDANELLAYITDGKPLADPRVEFPHPGRGGYPPLTDEQLAQLADYLQTLVTK